MAKIAMPDPDQIMIAGVAPVGIWERLGWLARQPMQPRREQRPLDIGFWTQCGISWRCFNTAIAASNEAAQICYHQREQRGRSIKEAIYVFTQMVI